MATAAQIAARKLFAQRAKAGTLRKNPAKKKAAPAKKRAVNRPSQATGAAPSKRLKARRRANVVPGAFPNPKARNPNPRHNVWMLRTDNLDDYRSGTFIAGFDKKLDAVEYANALAKRYKRQYVVEST